MKKIIRADSFVDHLVCPTDRIKDEFKYARHRSSKLEENMKDNATEKDRLKSDLSGWEINSSDDPKILGASTSHSPQKKYLQRAKTSPGMARITSEMNASQPLLLTRRKISTPSEKVRRGARCFLAAFSNHADPKLDAALMNLMGKKNMKYVI